MSTRVIDGPDTEPITLVQAKAHLRVTASDEDTLITSLITVVREMAEDYCQRSFALKTYRVTLDEFPDEIKLEFPPIVSVESVAYTDADGNPQTLAEDQYSVDIVSQPGWILPAYDVTWPDTQEVANAVTADFIAGAADATANQAMLLMLAHLYENRGDTSSGEPDIQPMAAKALLNTRKVYAR